MKSNAPLSLRDISPKGETILIHLVIFSPWGECPKNLPRIGGGEGLYTAF